MVISSPKLKFLANVKGESEIWSDKYNLYDLKFLAAKKQL